MTMFEVGEWDTDAATDDISKGISQKLPKFKKKKIKAVSGKSNTTEIGSNPTDTPKNDNKSLSHTTETGSIPTVDSSISTNKSRKNKSKKNKFKTNEPEQKLVGAENRTQVGEPSTNLKRKALLSSSGSPDAKCIKVDNDNSKTQNKKAKRKRSKKQKGKDSSNAVDDSISPSQLNLESQKSANKDNETARVSKASLDDSSHISPRNTKSKPMNVNKLKAVISESKTTQKKETDQGKSNPKQQKKPQSLAERMKEKLTAARFRFLNEQLYTQTGGEAQELFQEDPNAFRVYHEGFESQVTKWPSNPAERVIKYIRTKGKHLVVADFGCGDAKVARALTNNTVHSFDLVALNKHVTACDMANVPLNKSSVDICVFCLSLMGTNLVEYLCEANRVLKQGGTLLVAEVVSRFENTKRFARKLDKLGFTLVKQDDSQKMFVWFEFRKTQNPPSPKELPRLELAPCTYKKR